LLALFRFQLGGALAISSEQAQLVGGEFEV
jgi:hypothetical protein